MKLKKRLIKLKKYKKRDREKSIYDAPKKTYDFRIINTIRAFYKDIYNGKITLEEPVKDQSDLADETDKFIKETRPKDYDKKQEKEIVIKHLHNFLKTREMVLNGFKSKMFLTKSTGTGVLNADNSKLKILTSKQMLQQLTIAVA